MAYRHNDTLHKHQRRADRLRKFAFVFGAAFFIVTSIIGVDWLINQVSDTETAVSRETSKSVQSANVSVYRTEFFQFQAPESWVEVSSESTDKKFVYVKNNGTLITTKLVIYIDRPETDLEADYKATRVLPINIDSEGNFIKSGNVSEHCKESWPPENNLNPARITHANVSFVCTPDSVQYNAVVGLEGGTESIPATLKSGKDIKIAIVYSDLTAYPTAGDMYNIVSSFSTL
jgi:hypothetical protein